MKDLVTLLQNVPTVKVRFYSEHPNHGNKEYTYKTNLPLAIGDFVVVQVKEEFKVVKVVKLDSVPAIETNCDYPLKWIITKVDISGYDRLLKHDETCTMAVTAAENKRYRENMLGALREDYGEEAFAELTKSTDIQSMLATDKGAS